MRLLRLFLRKLRYLRISTLSSRFGRSKKSRTHQHSSCIWLTRKKNDRNLSNPGKCLSRNAIESNSSARIAQPMSGNPRNRRRKKHSSPLPIEQRLLFACNPCSGSTSSSVVLENYKFQINGSKRSSHTDSWEREKTWNIVTRIGNEFVTKKVILKKCKNKRNPDDDPLEASSRYRLSTSSSNADASVFEHQYSWDKELSFVSGDEDHRYSAELLDLLEASSKDVFTDVRKSTLEQHMRSVENRHFPSPDGSGTPLLDREVPSVGIHSSSTDSERELSRIACLSMKCNTPGETSERSSEVCKDYYTIEEASDSGYLSPYLSDIDIGIDRQTPIGVAVAKDSTDPYKDYRDSMLEMSVVNNLQQASEFKELLKRYISLNPPEFHGTIVEVFTELFWKRLAGCDGF